MQATPERTERTRAPHRARPAVARRAVPLLRGRDPAPRPRRRRQRRSTSSRRSIAAGRADDRLEIDRSTTRRGPTARAASAGARSQRSFLFNIWRKNDTTSAASSPTPCFARIAAQALGATSVRVLEDDALTKDAHSGGRAELAPGLRLLAPRAAQRGHGVDRASTTSRSTTAPCAWREGATSSANGCRRSSAPGPCTSADDDPAVVAPITDPADAGLERRHHRAGARQRRRCTTPSPGTRPAPTSPSTPTRQRSSSFVADGTTWFGAQRYEFNYSDAELGSTRRSHRRGLFSRSCRPRQDMSAALRIDNGRVLAVCRPDGDRARSVVIDGDRIAWVGPTAELPGSTAERERDSTPPDDRVPGLVDAHMHISFGEAASEEELSLHTPPALPGDPRIVDAAKVLAAGVTSGV